MKTPNPNSKFNRFKRWFTDRWSSGDYPSGEPRFKVSLFAIDIGTFILLPLLVTIIYIACTSTPKRAPPKQVKIDQIRIEGSKSQIIDFNHSGKSVGGGKGIGYAGISKRAPGSLVKVKLLNEVETYSTAPVHAQIIDAGLGGNLMGGTLIGDANPDTTFERINITFRFARDPNRDNIAIPIAARALGMDGTLGLNASKKEGFIARSAFHSANGAAQEAQGRMNSAVDFKEILFRALTAGMVQEFGSGAQVEENRSQVLTLSPSTEFFVELTDYFPGGTK